MTIHQILPKLHTYIVPKYIQWHSANYWNSLAGEFPKWPKGVAVMDCTPFKISHPAGNEMLHLSTENLAKMSSHKSNEIILHR